MEFDVINFSNCCIKARRIMVDYEDKGWINLLDMDHIMCGQDIVSIQNCGDCPDHAIEHEEEMNEALIESWIAGSIWGRNNDNDSDGGNGSENSEERKVIVSELPE